MEEFSRQGQQPQTQIQTTLANETYRAATYVCVPFVMTFDVSALCVQ